MDYYWTAGRSNNTDTSILSSWNWEMADGTFYPMTYMNWKGTEPNNKENRGENLCMLRSPDYDWIDFALTYNEGWAICEYNVYV